MPAISEDRRPDAAIATERRERIGRSPDTRHGQGQGGSGWTGDDREGGGSGTGEGDTGEEGRPSALRRWATRIGIVLALALTAFLLHRTLSNYSLAEIGEAMGSLPATRLAQAAAFAAASYACLTLFDTMAIRYVGHRIPYPKVALTSFVSLSIGHSLGLAGLSSGAIRYRFYARWGLGVQEVAKVILFTGLTVGVGLMTLAGLALAFDPALAADLIGVSSRLVGIVAGACLAGTAGYLAAAAFVRRPLKIRRFRMELPSLRLAGAQVLIGTVNFALVSACLYHCLAAVAEVPYLSVVSVYVSANVATLVTHVPGGLGVIETITLALVSGPMVIGAVLAFRVIYFLVPLAIGSAVFAATEALIRR